MIRKVNRTLFIGVIITLIAIIGLIGFKTWQTWVESSASKEKPSLYSSAYQATEYKGKKTGRSIISNVPDGVSKSEWKVSSSNKADESAVLLPPECSADSSPSSLLYTRSASGGGVQAVVGVFGAGQAMKNYSEFYVKQMESCESLSSDSNSIWWDNGFMITRGDVIVRVTVNDSSKIQSLKSWYLDYIDSMLTSSGCKALDETVDDARRSYYYDQKAYTGLFTSETVSVDDHIIKASVPQDLINGGMSVSNVFTSPVKDTEQVPESPLPQGMQPTLPSAPQLTALSAEPTEPSKQSIASYQTQDTDGPGCGWSWTGQVAPKYDTDVLKRNRAATIKTVKAQTSKSISDYNSAIVKWSAQSIIAMSGQTQWDQYTDNVNAIYASWDDLETKRTQFQPTWVQYVTVHNEYVQWKADYAKAEDQWKNSVKSCVASEEKDLIEQKEKDSENTKDSSDDNNSTKDSSDDNNSSSPSPSPSDSSSPSTSATPTISDDEKDKIQSDCEEKTDKPDILTKPAKTDAQKPNIPNGVTVPDSWPKPKTASSTTSSDDSDSDSND